MKSITMGLILPIIFALNLAWADDDYDFRKVKWNMSREEVKASESLTPIGEGKIEDYYGIIYTIKLLTHDVRLTYFFDDDDKLRGAVFMYEETEHGLKSDVVYPDFKHMLIKKYGQPKIDDLQSRVSRLLCEWNVYKHQIDLVSDTANKSVVLIYSSNKRVAQQDAITKHDF